MSPTIKNKNFTKEFYENTLKIQFYLQKKADFHLGKSDFSFIKNT